MHRAPVIRAFAAKRTYVCPSCLNNLSRGRGPLKANYSSVSSEDTELFGGKPPTLHQSWSQDDSHVDINTALKRWSSATEKPHNGEVPQQAEGAGIIRHHTARSSRAQLKVRKVLASNVEDKRPVHANQEDNPRALRGARQQSINDRLNLSSPEPGTQAQDSETGKKAKSRSAGATRAKKKEKNFSDGPGLMNGEMKPQDISIEPLESDLSAVPKLAHGLERVLFNPGFYFLQDPRSRVYNFDPYIEMIMPVSDFDWGALKKFTPSSEDTTLAQLTQQNGLRYSGSTSSMTPLLSHFHYLLSAWREINTEMLSATFPVSSKNFTLLQRGPAASVLRWNEEKEIYAIDSDKSFSTSNVLSMLGMSMEKLLTLETSDYERYRLSNNEPVPQEQRERSESYHFSTAGDFLFRSQLDARDPRLPGTGVFDLKTRAVIPVRMNVEDYQNMKGYEIMGTNGEYESWEREYHDMIRATFLKYSMQVRMGRMDGVFVAYHNTERIFGFQYIPLSDMDLAVHGQSDTQLGDQEFKFSLKLLNTLLDIATERYPKTSLRLHCEMRQQALYFFAEPVTPSDIEALNAANMKEEEQFKEHLLNDESSTSTSEKSDDGQPHDAVDFIAGTHSAGLTSSETTDGEVETLIDNEAAISHEFQSAVSELSEDGEIALEPSQAGVLHSDEPYDINSVIGDEKLPAETDRENSFDFAEAELAIGNENVVTDTATEAPYITDADAEGLHAQETAMDDLPSGESNAVDETSIKDSNAADSAFLDRMAASMSADERKDVLFLQVRIRNKIGDKTVIRPIHRTENSAPWSVDYEVEEGKDPDKNWSLYQACKRRRTMLLGIDRKHDSYHMSYIRQMRKLSNKGAAYRRRREKEEAGRAKVVV